MEDRRRKAVAETAPAEAAEAAPAPAPAARRLRPRLSKLLRAGSRGSSGPEPVVRGSGSVVEQAPAVEAEAPAAPAEEPVAETPAEEPAAELLPKTCSQAAARSRGIPAASTEPETAAEASVSSTLNRVIGIHSAGQCTCLTRK